MKNYGYTPTTAVSERKKIEKKQKDWKSNLDVEKSIVTTNSASKKALLAKYPSFSFNSTY